MRNWPIPRLACVGAIALGAMAGSDSGAATRSPGAERIDFGYLCQLPTAEIVEAPNTVSGELNLIAGIPVFFRRTTTIPAQRGLSFGVTVDVAPRFVGSAVIVTRHPPMGPDGVMTESWVTEFTVDNTGYAGFTFEYDYELLPGTWTFLATSNGRLIYEVDFEVVRVEGGPVIDCHGMPLS